MASPDVSVEQPKNLVVIVCGSESESDQKHAEGIEKTLDKFEIAYERRLGSAHKSTEPLLRMVREYGETNDRIVYVAIAGMSNALGAVIETHTASPVISTSPSINDLAGADVWSSLRTPSGLGSMTVLRPDAVGLAAAKILALGNETLTQKINHHFAKLEDDLVAADIKLQTTQGLVPTKTPPFYGGVA